MLSCVHVPHSIVIHEIYLDSCHMSVELQASFDSTVSMEEVDSPMYAEVLLHFCWEAIKPMNMNKHAKYKLYLNQGFILELVTTLLLLFLKL